MIAIPIWNIPNSKVHGANMGPIWGRQDPGGPNVGPMNFAIWDIKIVCIACTDILKISVRTGAIKKLKV